MRRSGGRNQKASTSSKVGSDHFFKKGEEVTDDFVPRTGDPSLYAMPYLGRPGDWTNEPPSYKPINDQKQYIRLDPRTTASKASSVGKTECEGCRCRCCNDGGPSRVGGRKVGARKPLPKKFRRIESMAMAAFEVKKMGKRLAMAASMFATGFAMGSMMSKCENDMEEGDEEEEENEDE